MRNLIALILLFSVSCTDSRVDKLEVELKNAKHADSLLTDRVCVLENHIAVQDSAIKVLIIHAQFRDSVSVVKQIKSDRAERRGKFLGGLLKTLIPGL